MCTRTESQDPEHPAVWTGVPLRAGQSKEAAIALRQSHGGLGSPSHPRIVRRVWRGVVTLVVIAAITTSCGGKGGGRAVQQFPQYVDEVADALGIARQSADDVLRRTAGELGLNKRTVALGIIPEAGSIRPIADDVDNVVAGLRESADEPTTTLEDFVFSVLCGELLRTIQTGTVATPDEMYDRSVGSFNEAIAEDLWGLGWLHDVEDVILALQDGDAEDIALAFTEALYC